MTADAIDILPIEVDNSVESCRFDFRVDFPMYSAVTPYRGRSPGLVPQVGRLP